jgi:hypothetical protein
MFCKILYIKFMCIHSLFACGTIQIGKEVGIQFSFKGNCGIVGMLFVSLESDDRSPISGAVVFS